MTTRHGILSPPSGAGALASARDRVAALGAGARAAAREPAFLVAAVALGLLLFLFLVLPIGAVLIRSLQTRAGALTLANYREFFAHRFYYRALVNSLLLGTGTTALVLTAGFVMAFLAVRGPRALRPPLTTLTLLPFVAPPFVFSIALIILAGRRGIIPQFLGLSFSIYGWPGVLLAQLLAFLPVAFLMIENVLLSLHPSYEDAGADLGAGPGRVFRTVTLPLLAPGLFKTGLLVFILSIADFGNPMIIGAGLSFLATDAYLLAVGEQNLEMASVLCVFLVLPSLVLFGAHRYLLRGVRVTTITGNLAGVERRPIPPAFRAPLYAVAGLVAATVLALFGLIFLAAFTETIGLDNRFTLAHFASHIGRRALGTSIQMSLAAGLLAGGLGILLAYIIARKPLPGRAGLEFVGLLGLAVPGTVVGLGYLLIFHHPPLVLTGTLLILVLNTGFRELAVGMEAGISKLHQLDPALEEASLDLGVGPLATFGKVVLPNLSSAFMAGLIYAFMTGMITVSAAVFLISPGVNLAAVYILQLAEPGYLSQACGVAVMLIVIVLGCVGLLKLIAGRTGFDILRPAP